MKAAAISILFLLTSTLSFHLKAYSNAHLSLQEMVEMERVASAIVSPDGNHVAYTKIVPRKVYQDDDGKPYVELWVKSDDEKARPFITGKQRVGGIQWGAKSQSIYFLAKRHDDLKVSIYKIAVGGGEAQKVVSAKNNITAFTVDHKEKSVTYLAKEKSKNDKEKLAKKGFKAKIYEESDKHTFAFLAQINKPKLPHIKLNIKGHVLSADYNPRNSDLLIRVAPSSLIDDKYVASSYQVVQQTGKLVRKFRTEGKLDGAQWSPNGKRVAIIGAVDKNDPSAGRLLVASVKTGKIKRFLADEKVHVKGLQWLSNYQLASILHRGTKSEVSVLNIDSEKFKTRVAAGEQVITSIHADQSGQRLISISSSDSHPRAVFDLTKDKVVRLSSALKKLKEYQTPKQVSISFKARDGITIEGILVYPNEHNFRKRYPLIMMVHGGPESHVSDGWLDRYSYPIKYAAANGFAVFLPNYRGSTGRGVQFSKMGQADYAGEEFNDLVDSISYLSEIGLVDKKRVGITGGSYGGYASAWAATALSEHFAASVMFVGISNQLSKFGTTDIPKEMHNAHAQYYPWEKWQWMLERSPIYHTDKAKTPILIMHGDSDTRVHPSQSMELYRYIKTRTDTPVRLVFYPDEGHGNKHSAAQLDYSIRLMRWMDFYLKGDNKGKEMPPYEIDHSGAIEDLD